MKNYDVFWRTLSKPEGRETSAWKRVKGRRMAEDNAEKKTKNVNDLNVKDKRKENCCFLNVFYVLEVFTYSISHNPHE